MDLDWLVDITDRAGHMVAAYDQQQAGREHLAHLAAEVHPREVVLQGGAGDLMSALESHPHAGFMRLVEEGLRSTSDYGSLGQFL